MKFSITTRTTAAESDEPGQEQSARSRRRKLLAGSILAMLAVLPTTVMAADWKPQLVAPESGIRGPSDPLRMRLPKLSLAVLQRLALELDDIDVTGYVSRDGEYAIFTPPQPLAYGDHRFRIVEYAADGSILERAAWTIEIRQSALWREAQFQTAATLVLERRIADDGLPHPEPSPNRSSGAARLQGAAADETWRLSGYADFIHNSQLSYMPRGSRGERTDIAQYLFAYEQGPVVALAGHQTVAPDSLILSAFRRRGISLGLHNANQSNSASVFMVSTRDVIGFQEGLGVSDDDNRTQGFTLKSQPTWGENVLSLSATYLEGIGSATAPLIVPPATGPTPPPDPTLPVLPPGTLAGNPTPVSGRAGNVVADSLFYDKRLRLRGEYAVSHFDPDGEGRDTNMDGSIDSNLNAERDHAYSALLTYVPWHDLQVAGKPMLLQFGVENKRVGPRFRSPANPFMVADRLLYRGFTGFDWSGINLQTSMGLESDNVDGNELLPRTETRQKIASLTYTPLVAQTPNPDGSLPSLPWYGQPFINLSFIGTDQDIVRGMVSGATGAMNEMRMTNLGVSASYPTWFWTLGQSLITQENFLNTTPDTEITSTFVALNLRLGQRVNMAPHAMVSRIHETEAVPGAEFGDSRTLNAGLTTTYQLTERISSSVSYNRYRLDSDSGSLDTRTSDVRATIAWQAIHPQGQMPGLTLSLEGQYRDASTPATASAPTIVAGMPVQNVFWDGYQVFLRVSIGWIPSFGMNSR